MGKIILLDELTINQIAAGEVVERPASVVKELVENSIDAGARNIVVEIKKGGIELIKITDDGSGIAEDDMEISFERHATSKIRSSSDLETVTSMGFRGEALASIAAIANVEMVSKTADEDIGHRIVVEGGELKEKGEIGCQKGTTITVQKLFYNTPVRYKFLRKDYTEAGYIEDVITRIALVNKNVAIKLINSGKTVIQTSGNNDTKSVVYSIYGKDVANGIIDIDYEYEGMKLTGVIGKPEISRGNRGYQLFFINGRYVKDKNFTAAADQAYKDILPIGKYGFIILNIEMDPKLVDVNVHPAKLEVRFENESMMFKAVYHAIKSGLENVKAMPISEERNYSVEEKKNFNPTFSADLSKYGLYNKIQKDSNFEINKNIDDKKDEIFETKSVPSINEEKNLNNTNIEEKEEVDKIENTENKEKYSEIKPEEDIVQPKIRTGLAGLIKKVMGGEETQREEYEENLVEALFEARNGKRRTTPDFEENIENSKNIENKKTEVNANYNFTSEIKNDEDEEKSIFETNNEKNKNIINTFDTKTNNEIISRENLIEKNEKDIELKFDNSDKLEETVDGKAVKIGKASILSDTKGLDFDIDDVIKKQDNIQEVKIEENGLKISNEEDEIENKTENALSEDEEIELVNKEENIIENKIESTEENKEEIKDVVKESISNIDKLTDSIIKNKIDNTFEPTQFVDTNKIRENLPDEEENNPEVTPEFAEMYKKTFGKDITKKVEDNAPSIEAYNDFLNSTSNDNLNVFDNEESYIPERKYRYVGNVFDSYFIIEMNSEMYIIDQKSAYERIVYEKVKENYYNEVRRDSQMLLLPDIIALSKKQFLIAGENIDMFEKAGFGFEEFGENTVKLYAVPGLCEKLNTKQLFIDILDGLDSVAITAKKEKEEKFLSTIAYKSAIKARINLDQNEIIDIINSLLRLQNPFIGSDNRQIAIKMTKIDFERKFSRR